MTLQDFKILVKAGLESDNKLALVKLLNDKLNCGLKVTVEVLSKYYTKDETKVSMKRVETLINELLYSKLILTLREDER